MTPTPNRTTLAAELHADVLDLCRRAGLDPSTAPAEAETLRRALVDLAAEAALDGDDAALRADVRVWERKWGVSRRVGGGR